MSPYGMTVVSVVLFLIAYCFPPSVYSNYLGEPDYLFFDPTSLLFFLLCVLGFVVGLWVVNHGLRPEFACIQRTLSFSPMWFLLLPILAGIGIALLGLAAVIRGNPEILDLFLALEGVQLKGNVEFGKLIYTIPLLMGIICWTVWRKSELSLSKTQAFFVNISIITALMAALLVSMFIVTRGSLIPVFTGIFIVMALVRYKAGKLTPASLWRFGLIFTTLIILVFASFALLRGANNTSVVISNFLGYTIASYNRLASILDGKLRYPFAGHGIYISEFVSFNNMFNNLFHVNRLFGWPDFYTVWGSEFDAVSAAGLNGQLIWSGTFGYLFADLGWLTPFMLFVYGLITGWTWRLLRQGKTTGVVLYPWCAYCILAWFGANTLLGQTTMVLLPLIIVLRSYESLFSQAPTEAIKA
jgi:hypothetical protein